MDHGIGVMIGVMTCRPPTTCARRRTVGYDRAAPAPKDEKVIPALSTGGGPPATQMEFHSLVQLCEATTSRSSTMLSQMTFFYVWNASTSRLIR